MKGRYLRLVTGALMPAAIGVLLFTIMMLAIELPSSHDGSYFKAIKVFFLFLVFGYVFAGIQSILYSVAMEFYINPKFKENGVVISISTAIGAICGLMLGPPGVIIGGVSGFFTGLSVRKLYVNAANK